MTAALAPSAEEQAAVERILAARRHGQEAPFRNAIVVELRAACAPLEARVAELEAEREDRQRRGDALARDLEEGIVIVRAMTAGIGERDAVIVRLTSELARATAEHDGLAAYLASRAAELGDSANPEEDGPTEAAKLTIETMLFERAAAEQELAAARAMAELNFEAIGERDAELARVRAERDEAVETMDTTHDMRELEIAGAVAREREACVAELIVEHDNPGPFGGPVYVNGRRAGLRFAIDAIRARSAEPAPVAECTCTTLCPRDTPEGHDCACPAHRGCYSCKKSNPPRHPLPPGWGWQHTALFDARGRARAEIWADGGWELYNPEDFDGRPWRGTAKPNPGETPLAAAQREVEEEAWKRGLIGEVGS